MTGLSSLYSAGGGFAGRAFGTSGVCWTPPGTNLTAGALPPLPGSTVGALGCSGGPAAGALPPPPVPPPRAVPPGNGILPASDGTCGGRACLGVIEPPYDDDAAASACGADAARAATSRAICSPPGGVIARGACGTPLPALRGPSREGRRGCNIPATPARPYSWYGIAKFRISPCSLRVLSIWIMRKSRRSTCTGSFSCRM